jgi:hypothetical protein
MNRTLERGARALATMGLVAGLAGHAASQTPEGVNFFLVDAAAPSTTTQTAKRGKPLMIVDIRTERAARLEGAVNVNAVNAVGSKLKYAFPAGQVLMGSANRPGVYCAPVKNGLIFATAPCLTDADNDGRFEGAISATFTSGRAQDLAISAKGSLYGVDFASPAPLAAPAAYQTVDYLQGAPAKARLMWRASWDRKDPAKPPVVSFWLDASDAETGTQAITPAVNVTLGGGPAEADVYGVRVQLQEVDRKAGLSYRIVGVRGGQKTAFAHVAAPTTLYIYH